MVLAMADVWLSVDYGTSNTVAMLSKRDGVVVPVRVDGDVLLPSAVAATADGRLLTGREAERAGALNPGYFEPNPKRRIEQPTILLGSHEFVITDVIAATLRRVEAQARALAGTSITHHTLTHPVTWSQQRKDILREAALKAGLPEPSLLPEPVAAAAEIMGALREQTDIDKCIVVYDLGAGTCDVSVLRRTETGFQVLSDDGLDDVGGVDLDEMIVDRIGRLERHDTRQPLAGRTPPASWRTPEVRRDARAARERLSREASTMVRASGLSHEAPLTREEFERDARPLIARTIDMTLKTIRHASLMPHEVAGWFLVGGAAQTPMIATMLHQATGHAPTVPEEPQTVVAQGALHLAISTFTTPVSVRHSIAETTPDVEASESVDSTGAPQSSGGRFPIMIAAAATVAIVVTAVILLLSKHDTVARPPSTLSSSGGARPPSGTSSTGQPEQQGNLTAPVFEWVQPANHAVVQRCNTIFRIRLLRGTIPADAMLVISLQRVGSTSTNYKAGFTEYAGERNVWELPLTVGSEEKSNEGSDFGIGLLLMPSTAVARQGSPDAGGYVRWSLPRPDRTLQEVAERLTVQRATGPSNCPR